MRICKVKGCDNKHYSRGYCNKHYLQLKQNNKILKRTRFDKNEIIDCGDYYEICLYSGQGEQKEIAKTKIDKDDLDKVENYKWNLSGNGYIINNKNKIYLHQLILGKKKGYIIDHINHNTLNNRKQNLRYCTYSQNHMNTKAKGYTWNKKNKRWQVYIQKKYKFIYLGSFLNEQQAIIIRKKAEKKYFREFTYNNLIN